MRTQGPLLRDANGRPLRVLVADDHDILREALTALLTAYGADVVGVAGDGDAAVRMARELRPDVIVMDMTMPALGGVDATRLALRDAPGTKIVAVSAHSELAWVERAFDAGAAAYVLKDAAHEDLVSAIQATQGGAFVSRRIPGGAAFVKSRLERTAER